jgi:TorA maturation chaperone TorD
MTLKFSDEITRAESLAGTYALLASLLNKRPDTALVTSLRSAKETFFQQSAEDSDSGITLGLTQLANFVQETINLNVLEVEKQLAIDWTCLFRGVSPDYGPPPPYEGLFHSDLGNDIEILQQVNTLYHSKGAALTENASDRPDYLGIELSFVSFLYHQAGACYRLDDSSSAQQYIQESEDFINKHLNPWVASYLVEAHKHVKTDFYRGVLQLLEHITTTNGNHS